MIFPEKMKLGATRLSLGVLLAICAVGPECARAQGGGTPKTLEKRAGAASRYVFTDESAQVRVPGAPDGTVLNCTVRVITRNGWGQSAQVRGLVRDGQISVTPLEEGIHLVQIPPTVVPGAAAAGAGTEARFLAMAPPGKLNRAQLMRALPFRGQRLLAGKEFRVLSLGDSVTATGDYEGMLVRMLERATGSEKISFVEKAHSGRSVDASVREWVNEGPPSEPDLGLIMYGLNDEATNVPLDAFLEQYRWLAEQFRDLKADCAFLQPTPDTGIAATEALRKPDSNAPEYIVRTVGFGEALRPLAAELKLPLAETFLSVWGRGGGSLEDSARAMWPLFPPSYSRQMNTLLETEGSGDSIHPNALGHLQIARAVYKSLGGEENQVIPAAALALRAHTAWTEGGVRTYLTARNVSKSQRAGTLTVQQPSQAKLEVSPLAYDLKPGQETRLEVAWSQAQTPEDLLKYPANRYLAQGQPVLPVVDFSGQTSRVYAVTAPFDPLVRLQRGRQVVAGKEVPVRMQVAGSVKEKLVALPERSPVGRIPLVEKFTLKKKPAYAVGEVVYVQYGAARSGEATVDGNLEEWADALWVPLGLPVQARSWRGPEDNRAQPRDCDLSWAFKAGKDGLYLACRGVGAIKQDSFTMFFDPRDAQQLGTAGRYYWISGKMSALGKVDVRKGETSKEAPKLRAAWQETAVGADIEFFVPYAALDLEAWPKSGDLGLSLIWTHTDALGRRTQLLWSENGHWWNPRWFGVVRRTDEKTPELPYMVRVE